MRATLTGILISASIAGLFVTGLPVFEDLNTLACDLVTAAAGRGQPSGKVAIIEIDEPGISRYGRWPWPRDLMASLVSKTFERGAAVVALDMALTADDKGDETVAGAMRG